MARFSQRSWGAISQLYFPLSDTRVWVWGFAPMIPHSLAAGILGTAVERAFCMGWAFHGVSFLTILFIYCTGYGGVLQLGGRSVAFRGRARGRIPGHGVSGAGFASTVHGEFRGRVWDREAHQRSAPISLCYYHGVLCAGQTRRCCREDLALRGSVEVEALPSLSCITRPVAYAEHLTRIFELVRHPTNTKSLARPPKWL